MKQFPSAVGLALLAGICLLPLQAPSVLATPPVPETTAPFLEVIATNGAGNEKHLQSLNGRVPLVLVRLNQAVPITLQFPTDKAGTQVAVTPLDGGRVNGGNLVVLPTGKVVLTFSPGPVPGRYRVMVNTATEQHLLEFYVVDPANPPFKSRAAR